VREREHAEETLLVGKGPTFGLWYDFRQKLPPGDYARLYAECLEEIEEVYIGAFADPAIYRAARLADGFLASVRGGDLGETYRKVMAALERQGRAGEEFPYVASGIVFVHEDAGRAREIVGPAIAYQRTRYAEWGTDTDKPRPEPIREEDLPWERYLVGTPEEVAAGLSDLYQEAHLCFWGRLPGVTHEQAHVG
jgi:alkanesulfonate monooxygenase SsuD/methylene tetrahydromethanopterin reductase-like flavin-dependent oxidoreductase (luciferase family)